MKLKECFLNENFSEDVWQASEGQISISNEKGLYVVSCFNGSCVLEGWEPAALRKEDPSFTEEIANYAALQAVCMKRNIPCPTEDEFKSITNTQQDSVPFVGEPINITGDYINGRITP